MAHNIKCVACKGSHQSIVEMKSCHKQHNVFHGQEEGPAKVQTKVQTKAKPQVKTEVKPTVTSTFRKFNTREEAEEFISANSHVGLVIEVKNGPRRAVQDEAGLWHDVTEKTFVVRKANR